MPEEIITGRCYLVVSARSYGAYPGNGLIVKAHHKRPRIGPDEYIVPLLLKVPLHCLRRASNAVTVEVPLPPDPEASCATTE